MPGSLRVATVRHAYPDFAGATSRCRPVASPDVVQARSLELRHPEGRTVSRWSTGTTSAGAGRPAADALVAALTVWREVGAAWDGAMAMEVIKAAARAVPA